MVNYEPLFPMILGSTLTLFSNSCGWYLSSDPPVHSQLLYYMKFRLFQLAQGIGISFLLSCVVKKKKVCERDSLLFPQRYSRCCSRLGIPNHPLTYYSSHSPVTLAKPENSTRLYTVEKPSSTHGFTHMCNKHG